MEPVPEPAVTADGAGRTDAEPPVDGRPAVVARTVVSDEIVVSVTSPVDLVDDDVVEVDIVEVEVAEIDDLDEADEVVEVTAEVVEVDDLDGAVEVVEVVEVTAEVVDVAGTVEVTDDGPAISYDELLAAAEQALDDVDGALARLQDGTYGRCEVCDDGISDDRLAAAPTARTCERHLPLAHAN